LDASQSSAVAELDMQLKAEAELLSFLQLKALERLELNNQRECTELEQRIEMRRTVLDQKVNVMAEWQNILSGVFDISGKSKRKLSTRCISPVF